MGNTQNKKKVNYSYINIPDGFTMLKIITFNILLHNSINIYTNIYEITKYLFSEKDGLGNDIMCIQGILDKYSSYEFIKSIRKVAMQKGIKLYFSPEHEDIMVSETPSTNISFNLSWSHSKPASKNIKSKCSNLLISKYPILTQLNENLDDNDDVYSTHAITVANILIKDKIISIYNINLFDDMVNMKIDNTAVRTKELSIIKEKIDKNIQFLNSCDDFSMYINNNINLVMGNFNINEIIFNEINPEYGKLIAEFHYVDIYRYMNTDIVGNISTTNSRNDYIMLYMTNDVYDEKSEYIKELSNIKSQKDLFNIMYKRYKIYFIDIKVNTSLENIKNYPIECTCML